MRQGSAEQSARADLAPVVLRPAETTAIGEWRTLVTWLLRRVVALSLVSAAEVFAGGPIKFP